MLGCRGLLSGMGSVVADLQSALFAAVQANDLVRARVLNDRLHPLASAFYADPFVDMHNRMKAALVLLGGFPVRPCGHRWSRSELQRSSAFASLWRRRKSRVMGRCWRRRKLHVLVGSNIRVNCVGAL